MHVKNFLRFPVIALLMLVGACAPDPAPEPGVWAYTDAGPVKLQRLAYTRISSEYLAPDTLAAIPTLGNLNALVVKSAAKPDVHWQLAAQTTQGKDTYKGVAEALEEDPQSLWIKFEKEPTDGLLWLRVKGGKHSGWYPFVVRDSESWALLEGHSWFQARKYAEALAAYERALDFTTRADTLRARAQTLLYLKRYPEALDAAEDAFGRAKKEEKPLVPFGSILGEAHMMNGAYKDGLAVFDTMSDKYPGDKELAKNLGRLLEGVEPSPGELLQQVYVAARKQGNDGVEPFVLPAEIEQKGEAALSAFTRALVKYGRVKKIQVRKTSRFGRTARVAYTVRFSDGTKLDRSMRFYLNDAGRYKIQLD